MVARYLALEIAKWFINATDRESGDDITHLKVQKLLYYAQGWRLANFREPLFDEDLQAWAHGPVAPTVWDALRVHGFDSIPPQRMVKRIDSNVTDFLEAINEEYGIFSAKKLERMTHSEPPWINARGGIPLDARCNSIISKKEMTTYFSKLEAEG